MTHSFTNDLFWDCKCKNHYIHSKTLQLKCPICNTKEPEMPDSMTSELASNNPTLFYSNTDYLLSINL